MSSKTTYDVAKKIRHATNAIVSFSDVPLRMIFYIGASIFLGAVLYAGLIIFNKVFLSHPTDGWTSIMVSVWLLGGMITSFIGIIGIYLSKIFMETKRRPYFIVRNVYGKQSGKH